MAYNHGPTAMTSSIHNQHSLSTLVPRVRLRKIQVDPHTIERLRKNCLNRDHERKSSRKSEKGTNEPPSSLTVSFSCSKLKDSYVRKIRKKLLDGGGGDATSKRDRNASSISVPNKESSRAIPPTEVQSNGNDNSDEDVGPSKMRFKRVSLKPAFFMSSSEEAECHRPTPIISTEVSETSPIPELNGERNSSHRDLSRCSASTARQEEDTNKRLSWSSRKEKRVRRRQQVEKVRESSSDDNERIKSTLCPGSQQSRLLTDKSHDVSPFSGTCALPHVGAQANEGTISPGNLRTGEKDNLTPSFSTSLGEVSKPPRALRKRRVDRHQTEVISWNRGLLGRKRRRRTSEGIAGSDGDCVMSSKESTKDFVERSKTFLSLPSETKASDKQLAVSGKGGVLNLERCPLSRIHSKGAVYRPKRKRCRLGSVADDSDPASSSDVSAKNTTTISPGDVVTPRVAVTPGDVPVTSRVAVPPGDVSLVVISDEDVQCFPPTDVVVGAQIDIPANDPQVISPNPLFQVISPDPDIDSLQVVIPADAPPLKVVSPDPLLDINVTGAQGLAPQTSRGTETQIDIVVPPLTEEVGPPHSVAIPDLTVSNKPLDMESECLVHRKDPNFHSSSIRSSPNFENGIVSKNCELTVLKGKLSEVHKDGIIFPELEQILNQDLVQSPILESEDAMVCGEGGREGVSGEMYEDYRTIMESEIICDWLKGDVPGDALTTTPEGLDLCDIDVNILCNSIYGSPPPPPPPPPLLGSSGDMCTHLVSEGAHPVVNRKRGRPKGVSKPCVKKRGRPRLDQVRREKVVKKKKKMSLGDVLTRTKSGRTVKPSWKAKVGIEEHTDTPETTAPNKGGTDRVISPAASVVKGAESMVTGGSVSPESASVPANFWLCNRLCNDVVELDTLWKSTPDTAVQLEMPVSMATLPDCIYTLDKPVEAGKNRGLSGSGGNEETTWGCGSVVREEVVDVPVIFNYVESACDSRGKEEAARQGQSAEIRGDPNEPMDGVNNSRCAAEETNGSCLQSSPTLHHQQGRVSNPGLTLLQNKKTLNLRLKRLPPMLDLKSPRMCLSEGASKGQEGGVSCGSQGPPALEGGSCSHAAPCATPLIVELKKGTVLSDEVECDFSIDDVIDCMDFDLRSLTGSDTSAMSEAVKECILDTEAPPLLQEATPLKELAASKVSSLADSPISSFLVRKEGKDKPVSSITRKVRVKVPGHPPPPPPTQMDDTRVRSVKKVHPPPPTQMDDTRVRSIKKVHLPPPTQMDDTRVRSIKKVHLPPLTQMDDTRVKKSVKKVHPPPPTQMDDTRVKSVSVKKVHPPPPPPPPTQEVLPVTPEASISPDVREHKEEDDLIDLYADDEDLFSTDTNEDPLSRIFPKLKDSKSNQKNLSIPFRKNHSAPSNHHPTPSNQYSAPSCNQHDTASFNQDFTPSLGQNVNQNSAPLGLPSPRIPHTPGQNGVPSSFHQFSASRPKIQSGDIQFNVHHTPPGCVPEQQGLIRPSLLARGSRFRVAAETNSNNNNVCSSSRDNYPSPPISTHFIATPLPASPCSTTSSQDSLGNYVATPPLWTIRYCHSYLLKGRCTFGPKCRFKHEGRDSVPLGILEDVMLSQPCQKIPTDVTQRYTPDSYHSSLLQSYFIDFIKMIHNLLKKDAEGVTCGLDYFNSKGVKFNTAFLCHLLDKFGNSHAHHRLIKITLDMQGLQNLKPLQDHLLLIRTLLEVKKFPDVKEAYSNLKKSGFTPDIALLFSLLRYEKELGEWMFSLFDDYKLDENGDGKEVRFLNRFLDIVDPKNLIKPQNLKKIANYLDRTPLVAGKLTPSGWGKLCSALCTCQFWGHVISLFHRSLRLLPSIRTALCEPLEAAIKHIDMSEKIVIIIERLTEEQKAGLSNEIWNKMLLMCIRKGRSQRAAKFYCASKKLSKHLSDEVMILLVQLFKKQNSCYMAMTVLRDGFQRSPPVIPALPLLSSFASSFDASQEDLRLMTTSLISNKISPPVAILEGLLGFCSKEKRYSILAEVVTLSRDEDIDLNMSFLQDVEKELKAWGQDGEALSIIAVDLERRGVACREKGDPKRLEGGTPSAKDVPKRKLIVKRAPPSPIAYEPRVAMPTQPVTAVPTCEEGGEVSPRIVSRALNLEDVLEESPNHNLHELVNLIQINGKQGQFGAIASILVGISSTAIKYDEILVLSIWDIMTTSKIRKANAFSSFLSNLDKSRSGSFRDTVLNSPTSLSSLQGLPAGRALLPSDRWLVSQIGLALVKLCEQNKDWQSGFVVLHHLHRFGIHYVKLSQPPSPLPPFLHSPPTPCSVMLMAVNMCLHVDDINSALEVMKGCDWVGGANEAELHLRTEMVTELGLRCLDKGLVEDTWKCLGAINSGEVAKRFLHPVTNLHNKLLQVILDGKKIDFALSVFKSMKKVSLQCLPSVFSSLLQTLCDADKSLLAKEFCLTAIRDSCYAPLIIKSLFEVTLPPGLIRLELKLLLEDHLRKVAVEIRKGSSQDLVVHLSAGSRDLLEQVLTTDITPVLSAKFESRLITISNDFLTTCYPVPTSSALMATNIDVRVHEEETKEEEKETGSPEVVASGGVRSKMDSESGGSAEDTSRSAERGLLKMQKQMACRVFISNLSHHYKEKFKTKEDYVHLLKALSRSYYRNSQIFAAAISGMVELNEAGKWVVPVVMEQEIKEIVGQTLSKFTVYSRNIDEGLGL